MTTPEKVAYLKGLAEGLGVDTGTKEGKILSAILDVLEDLALDQEDMGADIAELEEGLDAVSDDLEDVEEILFGDVEEDEDLEDDPEVVSWDGKTVYYDVKCPACGEVVTFEEEDLKKGSIQCPACGETLEFVQSSEKEADPSEE